MGAPTPQTLLEPIANSAASGTAPGDKTDPMPDAPTGTNAASVQGGFPPVTMQSELAGGEPPLGQDMNGFLFLISSHTFYVQSGQPYMFSSAVATAIGGYAVGTILGMTDGTGLWLCTAANNTSNPDAGGAGWVPIAAYGSKSIPIAGGTTTLTAAQSKYGILILTGVLASNAFVILPQTVQEWLVINNTSGAFTTTVLTAASGSVGVVVNQGGFGAPTGVYSIGDGNIYPTVAPLALNISVAPTNNSIVQRSNAGYVLATYFNTSAGTDNITPVTVFTNSGDGFLRQNSLTNFESFLLLQGIGGQVTNGQVPYSVVQQWVSTFLNNPTLTGVPVAPTAPLGSSGAQIATTAFANPGVTVNANGTCVLLPNNYKLQFGSISSAAGNSPKDIVVSLPVAFSTNTYAAFASSTRSVASAGEANLASGFTSSYTTNSFVATIDNSAGNPSVYLGRWFAFGI